MLSILGHQRPFPDRYVSSRQTASALSRMFLNTYRLRDNGIRVAVLQLNAYRLPRPTEWEDRDFGAVGHPVDLVLVVVTMLPAGISACFLPARRHTSRPNGRFEQ
jgi:hypothetical protein